MLEKIKYGLHRALSLKQIRIPFIVALGAVTVGVSTLLGCSVKTVRISDGEKTYMMRTLIGDVSDVLKAAGLKSDRYRIVSLDNKSRTTSVNIEYTFPVYITVGDQTIEFETPKDTVSGILKAAGYTVDEYDMVEPGGETQINETAYIDYTDINYVTGTYTEAIPCGTETVYSDEQQSGTNTVENGADGVRLVSYTSKVVNGVTVETSINSTDVLAAAVNSRQVIGTKPAATVKTSSDVGSVSTLTPSSPIELDSNGIPVNYSNHMTVRATAYTYTGHNCATGVAPQPGYIAVNPKIIPYGTKMYIKSSDGRVIYGYAVAADTGGFVKTKPTNVDLFFSSLSACYSFGTRDVEIYILD